MHRTHDLLAQYDAGRERYKAFTGELERLLRSLIDSQGVHSITTRIKSRDSFKRKVEAKPGRYGSIGDVTDVVGVRIITYFADTVDVAARRVEEEFSIDRKNCVDHREHPIDRFGYQSLHYVVSLDARRTTLPEFTSFAGLKAELQLRTVLQHAWAEIEHDIGYKASADLPRSLRRPFYRVAALLETADDLFLSLRKQHDEYRRMLPEQLRRAPNTVLLDRDSLTVFIRESDAVHTLDDRIASFTGSTRHESPDSITRLLEDLSHLGITTIEDLDALLRKNADPIVRMYAEMDREWLAYLERNPEQRARGNPSGPYGQCLFYLVYLLGAERGDREFIGRHVSADAVLDAHRRARGEA